MRIRKTLTFGQGLAILAVFCAPASIPASPRAAGEAGGRQQQQQELQRPTLVLPEERAPEPAARERELMCAGAIEQTSAGSTYEIVGSEEEQAQRAYGEGDILYISGGSQDGIKAGQEFSVVRPRGRFTSKFTRKQGPLGVYTQEVGRVRVTRIKDRVSVAQVVRSCDNILHGDLLRPVPQRVSPATRAEAAFDRFAEPSGKQTGRIVLARDGREMVSRDQVVFIDLGAEDNVKAGDYLTIYRPSGRGSLVNYGDEITANSRQGYESDQFRGGKFSNQAQRLKNPNGSANSETVKTPQIRKRRPAVPRKVVGEMVIIGVEGRTATAVITRVAQEVHTGDYVEVQ